MTEFKSEFTYDDRRKELTGSKIWTMQGEEEIKKVITTLNAQRTRYEQAVKQLKEAVQAKPEMTDDLKALKEQLIKLQTIDLAEKQETQLKQNEEDLKAVKSEIDKIKEVIGTRLKL